jgi:hypothetical protein
MLKSLASFIIALFTVVQATGCAYRFSNVAMAPPAGIRSIAIEAVYDTSQETISHELLWQALQRSFAENGRLKITDHKRADALVRTHIEAAKVSPVGTPSRTNESEDPVLKNNTGVPPNPSDVRKLTRAASWTTEESIALAVTVEIWDLSTQKMVFKNSYQEAANFRSYRSSDQALSKTHFLLFEEGQKAKLMEISKRIADKAVADFLL